MTDSQNAPAPHIIDWDEALKLANGNHDLAKEMLQLLVERLPEDRNDILAAFSQQDIPLAKRLTHKLRGALCYCGVPRLRGIVERLDNALKIPESIDTLEAMTAQLSQEVDALMDVAKQSATAS